jgi:hypothetical protein
MPGRLQARAINRADCLVIIGQQDRRHETVAFPPCLESGPSIPL